MKSVEDLKNRLKDPEFMKLFADTKSAEDIVKIAKEQGYEIDVNDVKNYEMSDDMLESVAGGKSDTTTTYVVINNGPGDIEMSGF